MEVIFRPEWNVNTVLWETVDKPKWKVYYLWLRLYVLCMQFELFRTRYEITLGIPINYSLVLDSPITLNHLSGHTFNKTNPWIVIDPRKYNGYRKCINDIQITLFNIVLNTYMWYGDSFINFRMFCDRVLDLGVDMRRHLEPKLIEFWNILGNINRLCTGATDAVETDAVLASFPRYGEDEKYITVANCVSCGEAASKKERINPEMIFCDIECQTLFYRNKNFRK